LLNYDFKLQILNKQIFGILHQTKFSTSRIKHFVMCLHFWSLADYYRYWFTNISTQNVAYHSFWTVHSREGVQILELQNVAVAD